MTETQQAERRSFIQIVRATSMLGGSSLINIVISVLRTKIAALLLGPTGIGLLGLFQNLVGTASAVAGLGINTVGAREIAEAAAAGDEVRLRHATQALFWGTCVLAGIGGAVFWAVRTPLSVFLTGNEQAADLIGWLTLGVVATVAAGSQTALLTGLRRLSALVATSISSAILATIVACAALYLLPRSPAMIVFIVAPPLLSIVIGQAFLVRAIDSRPARVPLTVLRRQWFAMARMGFWFTVAGLISALLLLGARTHINRVLGSAALGHFQASWAISSMYLSFILQAMGTEYYPRLTGAISDREAANRMVNAQAEILILFAAPAVLALLGFTPLVVDLLYSSAFSDTVWILRWQVLGDVFKLVAWPVSFIFLAAGQGKAFFLTETLASLVLVGFLWIATPLIGITATGLAFLVMYAIHATVVFAVVARQRAFRWEPRVVKSFLLLLGAATAVLAVAWWSEIAAMVVSAVATLVSAGYMVLKLATADTLTGPFRSVIRRLRHFLPS